MDPVRSNQGPRYKHVADEPVPYDTITVDKLTPIIGGEVAGVDLSKPLGNRKTSTSPLAGCSVICTSIRRRRTSRASRS
jgi:hypothetical protein